MRKDNFLQLGKNCEGFKILDKDFAYSPKNITADTLWNLWDIAVKFGYYIQKGIVFRSDPLSVELYDFRHAGGVAALFIARINVSKNPFANGIYRFTLKNSVRVAWDKNFPVSIVRMIMAEADLEAMADGYIQNNMRMEIIESVKTKKKKLFVKKIFFKSGSVYVLPPDTDDEVALSCFDRPELLDIINISQSIHVVCLKTEKSVLLNVFRVKIIKLKEMGVSYQDINKMSFEEIIALSKKT